MKASPAHKLRVACGNAMLCNDFYKLCKEQLGYVCSPFEITDTRDKSKPVGDHWVNFEHTESE